MVLTWTTTYAVRYCTPTVNVYKTKNVSAALYTLCMVATQKHLLQEKRVSARQIFLRSLLDGLFSFLASVLGGMKESLEA